jgi:hypothetical protein
MMDRLQHKAPGPHAIIAGFFIRLALALLGSPHQRMRPPTI